MDYSYWIIDTGINAEDLTSVSSVVGAGMVFVGASESDVSPWVSVFAGHSLIRELFTSCGSRAYSFPSGY